MGSRDNLFSHVSSVKACGIVVATMSDPQIAEAIASGRVPKGITEAHLAENRNTPSEGAIAIIFGLTALIMAVRLFSRIRILRTFGLDDALAVLSLLFLAAFVGLSFELIRLGRGRHFSYLEYVMSTPVLHRVQHLDLAAHVIYATTLLICRMSGLAFYFRVCGQHKGFRTAIMVVLSILVAGYLPQIFLLAFHCRPVTALWPFRWQADADQYTCIQWGLVYSIISGISLMSDLLLFGIPVVMLWMLQMSLKRKIELAGILLPGFFVVHISAARLVLVIKGQWDADESWTYNPMLGVETGEIGGTLIALSVPALKIIFDRLRGNTPSTDSSETPYRKTGSSRSTDTALSILRIRRKPLEQGHSVLESRDNRSDDLGDRSGTRSDIVGNSEFADNSSREGIVVKFDVDVRESELPPR